MTPSDKAVLVKWMNGEFRHAVVHDNKRLEEASWMLKVGHDLGEDVETIVSRMIASFVIGLIQGDKPISVPIENN